MAPIRAVKLLFTAVTRLKFSFGLFPLEISFKVTLIQWDGFFTVTLAPLGSISFLLCSVL